MDTPTASRGIAAATPLCDARPARRAAGQWNPLWQLFYELDLVAWTEKFMAMGS
ncbi:MAG: hypothetical protein U1F49_04290 [Rubrivivax sp.]